MNTLFIHIPLPGFVSACLPAVCMENVRHLRAVIRMGRVQQVSWLEDL